MAFDKPRSFFGRYFNLEGDHAEEASIVTSITRNISFRGANLWTLIFAIIIASVGLNVNATAVIIGAMLISPLMGPIMGVGLGIGIGDFDIVRKGVFNLLIAVVMSVGTSTLYFFVSPLHNANSELLARTTPTLWDVIIAFTGGLAGIIGATRKEKGNVVPGVAIATALMPPLCTAGFGLATGHFYYFLGAMYLFFINSVFICIATVLIVRFLKFQRVEHQNAARQKRVNRYIILLVIVTIAPSIFLAYRIVQKAVFENAASNFTHHEFDFESTQVVSKIFRFSPAQPTIELLLIGEVLDSARIDSIAKRLPDYSLQSTRLIVRQGLNARHQVDFSQVKASILDEVFRDRDSLSAISSDVAAGKSMPDLRQEIKALFPAIRSYSISNVDVIRTDTTAASSALAFIVNASPAMGRSERLRLSEWIKARIPDDSVQIVFR